MSVGEVINVQWGWNEAEEHTVNLVQVSSSPASRYLWRVRACGDSLEDRLALKPVLCSPPRNTPYSRPFEVQEKGIITMMWLKCQADKKL
jgi:hypothetical protein